VVTRGLDTTVLVEAEAISHPNCARTRALLEKMIADGNILALAPQVLAEFIHVITDGRRFERPLEMEEALGVAAKWWNAKEVRRVYPNGESVELQLRWMSDFRLGRKRLLDTQLAATYFVANVRSIVTANFKDYRVFEVFDLVETGAE